MYLIKATLIIVLGIFVLHLIPVLLIGTLVVMNYLVYGAKSEGDLAWLVFHIIDFPFIWFASSSMPAVETLWQSLATPFSNACLNYYWDYVVLPAVFFQIIGWINWCIVLGLPLLIVQMWLKSDT